MILVSKQEVVKSVIIYTFSFVNLYLSKKVLGAIITSSNEGRDIK